MIADELIDACIRGKMYQKQQSDIDRRLRQTDSCRGGSGCGLSLFHEI